MTEAARAHSGSKVPLGGNFWDLRGNRGTAAFQCDWLFTEGTCSESEVTLPNFDQPS